MSVAYIPPELWGVIVDGLTSTDAIVFGATSRQNNELVRSSHMYKMLLNKKGEKQNFVKVHKCLLKTIIVNPAYILDRRNIYVAPECHLWVKTSEWSSNLFVVPTEDTSGFDSTFIHIVLDSPNICDTEKTLNKLSTFSGQIKCLYIYSPESTRKHRNIDVGHLSRFVSAIYVELVGCQILTDDDLLVFDNMKFLKIIDCEHLKGSFIAPLVVEKSLLWVKWHTAIDRQLTPKLKDLIDANMVMFLHDIEFQTY